MVSRPRARAACSPARTLGSVAVGGDAERDVRGLGQVADLVREDAGHALPRGHPGHRRDVGGQRDRRAARACRRSPGGRTPPRRAARPCSAPPVPNTISLPPRWNRTAMAWQALATASACSARSRTGAARSSNSRPASSRRHHVHHSPCRCGGLREVDVDLDVDGVAHPERAEEPGVRLDPELGLHHRRGGVVVVRARSGDLQPKRPGLARQGERAGDQAAVGRRARSRGGEGRLGMAVGAQCLAGGHRDLAAVPVGERLDPAACPPARSASSCRSAPSRAAGVRSSLMVSSPDHRPTSMVRS